MREYGSRSITTFEQSVQWPTAWLGIMPRLQSLATILKQG